MVLVAAAYIAVMGPMVLFVYGFSRCDPPAEKFLNEGDKSSELRR